MAALTLAESSAQHHTSLLRLRARQCRFIVSDNTREAVCCGAPTRENSSWCNWHRELVFIPERERRRAA